MSVSNFKNVLHDLSAVLGFSYETGFKNRFQTDSKVLRGR